MKWMSKLATWLTLACALACPALAQTTVTVTGDLEQLFNVVQAGQAGQTYVVFKLENYGGNVPRINGTGIIAPCKSTSDTRCQVVPDAFGHFTTSLYGNDAVTPANSYYTVLFYVNGRLLLAGTYQFTQALCVASTCNLDTYAQLAPAPTPAIDVAPFLSTNNIYTGTNTYNGAVTFNSTVTFAGGAQTFLTPKFTPPITINTTNNYTWNFTNPAAPRTITWPDSVDASVNVQYSTGTRTSLNLLQFNANGNAVDSGIATSTVAKNGVDINSSNQVTATHLASPLPTAQGGTAVNSTATFPASGVVDTTTAANALQNHSLTGASSGNSVTLLNMQVAKAAIVGNSTALVVYTYTLPANTLGIGKGIRVSFGLAHGTGTALVTYQLTANGTILGTIGSSVAGFDGASTTWFNTVATNTQHGFNFPGVASFTTWRGPADTNIDTTSSVVISLTFNVAATDQVTPSFFMVELIQ